MRLLQSRIAFCALFLLFTCLFSWLAFLFEFATFVPYLLGTGLAGLIAYWAYVYVDEQPIRLNCPTCNGIVVCKTPWVCGECGSENWDVRDRTFLDSCGTCGLAPKSYLCHHCGKPMFLSEDLDATNPARRIGKEGRATAVRDKRQRKGEEKFVEEKANLERELEAAKIQLAKEHVKAEISVVKKGLFSSESQVKTALELKREALRRFKDDRTATMEAARLETLEAERELKDNPVGLRKVKEIILQWKRQELKENV